MKPASRVHTTNYTNTFIQVAEDCPTQSAQVPPQKGESKSVANLQFELLEPAPYALTSDELLFRVHAQRAGIAAQELDAERTKFFARGQPCLRASPLGKRYGWGVHCNGEGKVALYPVESPEYQRFAVDVALQQVRAMRTKKA